MCISNLCVYFFFVTVISHCLIALLVSPYNALFARHGHIVQFKAKP